MRLFLYISLLVLATACKQDKTTHGKVLFAENNDGLMQIIINEPPAKYCGAEHHHFVDIVVKRKIDSLLKEEVTSILFYRDWIGTNGFNGYGRLFWSQNGKCHQYQFNFENYDNRYGISSIDKSEHQTCDAIDFYYDMRIDTVKTSPIEPEFWMSHAADHFVYTYIKGEENCFNISGLNLRADSTHLKSRLIRKLEIDSGDYFDMLEERRNKK